METRRRLSNLTMLSGVVLAAVLVLQPAALAAAKVVDINQRLPVAFVATNPCDPVSFIELSGNIHVQGKLTIDDTKKVATLKATINTQGVQGQGFTLDPLSGEKLLLLDPNHKYVSNDQLQISVSVPNTPVIVQEKFKLISQGSTNNFFVTFRIQINDNGTVKIDIVEIDKVCRG